MDPQFRHQLPETSIGTTMMTPLAERAGLLRDSAGLPRATRARVS
jgi:hypothetical protein